MRMGLLISGTAAVVLAIGLAAAADAGESAGTGTGTGTGASGGNSAAPAGSAAGTAAPAASTAASGTSSGASPGAGPAPASAGGSVAGSSGTAAPGVGSDPKAAPPVILLTGYEPFGGADVNPSWEAVKHLDGTSWHGYRLVARELPVVWGAPLPALKKLMTDLQPVAVFSFGQGLPDRFTIETVAHRERGDYPDNDGQQPKEKKIADGAEQYEAGARAVAVEKKLAEKGYPIMASKDAGRYLCEECLYSLEYLHATEFKSIYVQFSHMPAWGNRIGPEKTEVTNAYEKQFVQDTLEAWWATRAGK